MRCAAALRFAFKSSLSSADEIKERIKKIIDRASKALSPQKSQTPPEHGDLLKKKSEIDTLLKGIEENKEEELSKIHIRNRRLLPLEQYCNNDSNENNNASYEHIKARYDADKPIKAIYKPGSRK